MTPPIFYAISSGEGADLGDWVETALAAGATWLQVREKSTPAEALFRAGREVKRQVGGRARILLNDRLDVALAAELDGVHLPTKGLPVAAVRRRVPAGFLIGKSCHSLAEIEAAVGADFVVFGPIFSTPSKAELGPPQGLAKLAAVCKVSPCPVLALGGIGPESVAACLAAGAAGIAGIRLFANPDARKSVE